MNGLGQWIISLDLKSTFKCKAAQTLLSWVIQNRVALANKEDKLEYRNESKFSPLCRTKGHRLAIEFAPQRLEQRFS